MHGRWIATAASVWIELLTWRFTYREETTTGQHQPIYYQHCPVRAGPAVSSHNPSARAASCRGRGWGEASNTNIYPDSLGLTCVPSVSRGVLVCTHTHTRTVRACVWAVCFHLDQLQYKWKYWAVCQLVQESIHVYCGPWKPCSQWKEQKWKRICQHTKHKTLLQKQKP